MENSSHLTRVTADSEGYNPCPLWGEKVKVVSAKEVGNGLKNLEGGIPSWSSGKDSALSLLRAQVQSLVWELRSHKPRRSQKKKTGWSL